MTQEPTAAERKAFLEARRWSAQDRYDADLASDYDRDWGEISASHGRFTARFLDAVRPGGLVLDVPCGTGKYWATVTDSARSVVGLDQSVGMLAVGRAKHAAVPVGRASLQELDYEEAFDGVMCVDAMEFVGPEDWPPVLASLRRAVRPGAPLWLTVELEDEVELAQYHASALEAGYPVTPRESFDVEGGGYHHYPERASVLAWLADVDLELIDGAEGDGYWHLLLRRPA